MRNPDVGDLLIQPKPGGHEFVIADAITRRVLSGPHATLADATARATRHALRVGVNLWRNNTARQNGIELMLDLERDMQRV